MAGKKNIVFGFLFLATTAALGPLMVFMYAEWGQANAEKQQVVGQLQQLQAGDYEEDPETLDELTAKQLAMTNSEAILAMNKVAAREFSIDYIKGGPHAHGNLESVLNILVGLMLCFITAPRIWKEALSWIFIAGTLMHSGLLYLERVFELAWASTLLNTGIGPALILIGLVMAGGLAIVGLGDKVVRD